MQKRKYFLLKFHVAEASVIPCYCASPTFTLIKLYLRNCSRMKIGKTRLCRKIIFRAINLKLLVKRIQLQIFRGNGHGLKITIVSNCLKVPTAKQEIDLIGKIFIWFCIYIIKNATAYLHTILLLNILNCFINFVKLAVTTTFHCDFHC